MSIVWASKLTTTISSPVTLIRELALAADRALWADNQTECAVIIDQIYDLYDTLDNGLEPDLHNYILAAETFAWINGRDLYESVNSPNGLS